MMLINTEEKRRCFELIKYLEKQIERLEQQGYSCEYYKSGIKKVKNIEGGLKLDRDFERTPYGYVFKNSLGSSLRKRYEYSLEELEKYKNELHINEKNDKKLEQILKNIQENLNYDIENEKVENYIRQVTPYLSSMIKKEDIKPLAEVIYKLIKVEYNNKFTTRMLRIIRSYGTYFNIPNIKDETDKTVISAVYKCLNKDLCKYNINQTALYFDSYLIEEIVKKENKNFITLDERLKGYIFKKNSSIYNILLNKLEQLKLKIKTLASDGPLLTQKPNVYKAALKRVDVHGEITSFSSHSDSLTRFELQAPDEIYVTYNKLHPKEAQEILTGKRIDVVDSETKEKNNLPIAFIERKIKNGIISFYSILPSDEIDFELYLNKDKDELNRQLEVWMYEGKKGLYKKLTDEQERSQQKVFKKS